MTQFSYVAMDRTGRRTKGKLNASSKENAMIMLEIEGLVPINLRNTTSELPWWEREFSLFGSKELSADDTLNFFDSVSTGLSAHLNLVDSLKLAEDTSRSRFVQKLINQLSEQIAEGKSLSASMEMSRPPFDRRLVAAVTLGERSNRLPAVFAQLATNLNTEKETRKEIKQSLVYPMILSLASMFVLGLLIFVLTPALAPLFADGRVAPPLALRAMMLARSMLIDWWLMLISGFICAYFGYLFVQHRLGGTFWALLHRLPYIRKIVRQYDTLAFCEALELILSSGGTIVDGLSAAAVTAQRGEMRTMLEISRAEISDGATLRTTVFNSILIDPTVGKILIAGDASNQLQQVLVPTINRLKKETRGSVDTFVKLLTPLITLVLGLLVGAIILSTISAILDLNDAVL